MRKPPSSEFSARARLEGRVGRVGLQRRVGAGMSKRIRIAIGVAVVAVLATSVWLWATAGRETTDDAQVDAHVAPIAARVGGTVIEVPIKENQQVDAGAVLVVIDPRDYQVAL